MNPEEPEEFVPENLRQRKRKPEDLEYLFKVIAGLLAWLLLIVVTWKAYPEGITTAAFLPVALMLYFVPTLAAGKDHRNRQAILALNLLLGWTFIGWVVALIWALYREKE